MIENDFKKFLSEMIEEYGYDEVYSTIGSDEYINIVELLENANEYLNPDIENIDEIMKKIKKKNYRPKDLIKLMDDKFSLTENETRGLWKKYNNVNFSRSQYWIRVL